MKTRHDILMRLQKESDATKSCQKLAARIGVNYVSLWRVVNGKSGGNIVFWDKVFEYYGK
jgi:arginine/lysine/ornithine decarboxylase